MGIEVANYTQNYSTFAAEEAAITSTKSKDLWELIRREKVILADLASKILGNKEASV